VFYLTYVTLPWYRIIAGIVFYLTYITLPWYRIIAGIVFYLTYVTEPWYQSKIIGKPYILKVFEMG
jgi:hypothetical protein